MNAFDLSKEEWKVWLAGRELPGYRASQILEWIYRKGVTDPLLFTNIPLELRELLASNFSWELPAIDSHLVSKDGSEKFLLRTKDDLLCEMVVMPYDSRVTLCVSSQVGCRLGCTFCQTGRMGLKRNLTSGEILAQILLAGRKVTNVVFMGMGEPLDNYDEVVKACRVMVDPSLLSLARSRVTISTAGVVPGIRRLSRDLPVGLAVSLHNADDAKRSAMMPINRRYPLQELKEALEGYPSTITFEYVMIEEENDTIADAKRLVKYLSGLRAKVNLIPLNHFPGKEIKASSAERIRRFQSYLAERSIPAPVRYSRGQDISGGCGQLAAKREGELAVDPRRLMRIRRQKMAQK